MSTHVYQHTGFLSTLASHEVDPSSSTPILSGTVHVHTCIPTHRFPKYTSITWSRPFYPHLVQCRACPVLANTRAAVRKWWRPSLPWTSTLTMSGATSASARLPSLARTVRCATTPASGLLPPATATCSSAGSSMIAWHSSVCPSTTQVRYCYCSSIYIVQLQSTN